MTFRARALYRQWRKGETGGPFEFSKIMGLM